MSFLNLGGSRVVPGVGPKNAKIAIVGEAPGSHEDNHLKPFVGPAGSVLEQCLHVAGLIRSEVYLTNVVKVRPKNNIIDPYFIGTKGIFTDAGKEWVDQLHRELSDLNPNIVVACGATAMAALTRYHKVMKYRGYIFESRGLDRITKVLPTIHPAAALRGMYLYRHIIAADLRKAREHSTTPKLERPERQLVYNFSSVEEVLEWLDYYEHQPLVCFDIEVMNFEVSCVGISSSPEIAISVPLDERWTPEEELDIWYGLQRVLGNSSSVKVVQNGMFDINFLLTRCGIEVRGPIADTMCGHSVMYPELSKSLAFLGSAYCGAQEYWKDMVKFNNIKEES